MEQSSTQGATASFARDLHSPETEVERLQVGLLAMVDLVEGCDHAGVTMVTKMGLTTPAATSEVVMIGDQLQYELNEGPCVDSVRLHRTVLSNDLANDRRWPRWGPAIADRLAIGSMMSLLLFTHGDTFGAVNLYAHKVDAYPEDALAVAESLAAHLAVAVSAGRELDHRGAAMLTRTIIGQAEGILMERYKVTSEQAFDMLRTVSQNSNQKLARVAEGLIRTGWLPGVDDTAAGRGSDRPASP